MESKLLKIINKFYNNEDFSSHKALVELKELISENYISKTEHEKLIYASCVKQKELCVEEARIKTKQGSKYNREEHSIDEDSILNTPLPTEVERFYSAKEVKEIADRAIDFGYYAGDVER